MWERVLEMLGWIMKSTKAEECQEEVDDLFHIFNYRNAVYGLPPIPSVLSMLMGTG